jgi:hypothetical protein
MKNQLIKYLLSGLALILVSYSEAQSSNYVFGNKQTNILYRGYKNKLKIAFDKSCSNCKIHGENLSLSKESDFWIAKPGSGRSAQLVFTDSLQNDTIKVIDYKVLNLPAPDLYFGATKSGGKASKYETRVFCKYPSEIPLNAQFIVRSIDFYSDSGRTISSQGNELTEEMQNELRALPPGSEFSIICRIVGPDGVVRIIGANYNL